MTTPPWGAADFNKIHGSVVQKQWYEQSNLTDKRSIDKEQNKIRAEKKFIRLFCQLPQNSNHMKSFSFEPVARQSDSKPIIRPTVLKKLCWILHLS